MFSLQNAMPSAIRHYEIEVWATYDNGAARCLCVLKNSDAEILSDSVVQLPTICALQSDRGMPASHVTKITAVQLANGWKWRAPQTYTLTR